jgi:hypothetical protein
MLSLIFLSIFLFREFSIKHLSANAALLVLLEHAQCSVGCALPILSQLKEDNQTNFLQAKLIDVAGDFEKSHFATKSMVCPASCVSATLHILLKC